MTSLSPTTIGEERPLGALTFHFTFLSGPSSTGGFWSSATPEPPGPRNCGQASGFSPATPAPANTPTATNAINVLMSTSSNEEHAAPYTHDNVGNQRANKEATHHP